MLRSKAGAETIAGLMASMRRGDAAAAGALVEALYPELKRLATAKMRSERLEHTLQPTALVNELYLELVKIKALKPPSSPNQEERLAFLGLAALLMKRLLIEHARPLARRSTKVEINEQLPGASPEPLVEVEAALSRLGAIKPQLRTVVEMKVFEGRTTDEIATELGCSTATVARHWNFARRWLQEELTADTQR
jgi:RNA polymerase sigma factor (TIGR02999 family)